ncbi:organic cation transporter protein [Patella vulgata]|uniref:organic cation transporter protein n=1 Tax=Patella vulgata TaxID=6465 RepID=UPI00217FD7BD|nr:organic cation transporter protein [Patella vulgata]
MEFEEIIKHLGDFGTYQKRLYYMLCISSVFTAIQVLLTVFTFGIPEHRCAVPGLVNDTFQKNELNDSLGEFVYEDKVYKQCSIYSLSSQNVTTCKRWVYDKSIFESSIITQIDIVCNEKIAKSHAQMLVMLGQVVGCAIVGPLSDRFGRKTMLCSFLIIFIISSIAVTWTPTIRVVFAFYFFIGTSISGTFTPAFVLGMELVGPKSRVWAGMITELFWSLGTIILAGAAYWIRNWQTLQLTMSVPGIILLSYFCLITESPRWLISKGRYKEAEKIIQKAAKVNKVVIPSRLLRRSQSRFIEPKNESVFKVFTSRILVIRTVIVYINWAACSLTFYGLTLNAGNLSGSIHLNFFLLNIIEVPAYVICIVLLDRIGRRILHCSSLFLSGACITLSIFTVLYADKSLAWITTLLAVIGKMGITAAFAIMWIYTTELFPTPFRNSAVGTSSLMARIAAAISPYIANIGLIVPGNAGKITPMIIFGITSIIAGLLALLLPETKGRLLPETIEDAEQFTK